MTLAKENTKQCSIITDRPKYLWILMVSYSIAVFASNWFDPRHIVLLGLSTGAGSIAFPLTYLLADTITEVYGLKNTRIAILSGLLFYVIFIIYGQFVVHFIAPDSQDAVAFGLFLHINGQVVVATCASLLFAEGINAYLVAKLKISFRGKYMGIRFLVSTLTAYLLDELIYAPIAFHGMMDFKNFISHMLDSWIFMVSIELLLLPFSVKIAKKLKSIEKLDIYDDTANQKIFAWDIEYQEQDNKYKSKNFTPGM